MVSLLEPLDCIHFTIGHSILLVTLNATNVASKRPYKGDFLAVADQTITEQLERNWSINGTSRAKGAFKMNS